MNFALSAEQKLIIETVRNFIAKELAPLEDEIEASGVLAPAKAQEIFEKSRSLAKVRQCVLSARPNFANIV